MKLLDLFAGIGGFSLAAHWLGWQTVGFVEKDEFCRQVLRKNFGQEILIIDDINDVTANTFPRFDIATFGLPCQPFSCAGKQRGTDDERYLWDAAFAVIKDYKPRWVVLENVVGFVKLALPNVQSDLERVGYDTRTFIIPACAVDAPHRRNRVWLVANADGTQKHAADEGCCRHCKQQRRAVDARRKAVQQGDGQAISDESCGCRQIASDSNSEQRPETRLQIGIGAGEKERCHFERSGRSFAEWREIKPVVCRGDNGLPNRVDRLKSLGNSIVPQIAFEIFKAIEAADCT